MVLPDNLGKDVTVGYGNGLSGAVGFLLRLRHGGQRQWMLNEFLTDARPYLPAGIDRLEVKEAKEMETDIRAMELFPAENDDSLSASSQVCTAFCELYATF